jgi:hypothetical protein
LAPCVTTRLISLQKSFEFCALFLSTGFPLPLTSAWDIVFSTFHLFLLSFETSCFYKHPAERQCKARVFLMKTNTPIFLKTFFARKYVKLGTENT